ncbi:MAG: bifunctional folylpolyglutamate synthase/dihydrofolate synthase [Fibrobacterota bacterium]
MIHKEEILKTLFSRRTAGIRPGLSRIRAALAELDNPHRDFHSVHIAGTNGKGSTAAFISSVFREAGCRTGLFTSPHILDFNERFIIDGTPVSDTVWMSIWEEIVPVCDRLNLTFFEISTVLAFLIFSRSSCEWAVIETGLGGRLDATNCLVPHASVITSIAMDHTEYLGSTIEEITREKLGIVKTGVPFTVNERNPESVFSSADEISRARDAVRLIPPEIRSVTSHMTGQYVHTDTGRFYIPFSGTAQGANAMTAVAVLRYLKISDRVIRKGLASAYLPARMEEIAWNDHRILLDTAHNPHAVGEMIYTIQGRGQEKDTAVIIGMMKDKDADKVVALIEDVFDMVYSVTLPTQRGMSAQELADMSRKGCVVSCETMEQALTHSRNTAGHILVCGSFLTVSAVYRFLGRKPYDSDQSSRGISPSRN